MSQAMSYRCDIIFIGRIQRVPTARHADIPQTLPANRHPSCCHLAKYD